VEKSLLLSKGEKKVSQTAQPHFGVVSLPVVPDEIVVASFIAVPFTPGRPKVNYATESHVLLFANTLRCR